MYALSFPNAGRLGRLKAASGTRGGGTTRLQKASLPTDHATVGQAASGPTDRVARNPFARWLPLRSLLLVSAAFLIVQLVLTDYGSGHAGAAVFWGAIGALLLLLVYRKRSRVARGVIVVTALVGAVIYGLATVRDPQAALLASAHLGQALPLLTSPVRRHVQARP